jgi:hypothetical protein
MVTHSGHVRVCYVLYLCHVIRKEAVSDMTIGNCSVAQYVGIGLPAVVHSLCARNSFTDPTHSTLAIFISDVSALHNQTPSS